MRNLGEVINAKSAEQRGDIDSGTVSTFRVAQRLQSKNVLTRSASTPPIVSNAARIAAAVDQYSSGTKVWSLFGGRT